jgi:hypothetical protein
LRPLVFAVPVAGAIWLLAALSVFFIITTLAIGYIFPPSPRIGFRTLD